MRWPKMDDSGRESKHEYESPLALGVAHSLRADIQSGKLPAGQSLPPERELADRLKVSRTTIRKGTGILAREGWLSIKPHCRPVVCRRPYSREQAKTDHVAVWLWPYAGDYSASTIFAGIQVGLARSGLKLMMATAPLGAQWSNILQSESDFLAEVAGDPSCAGAIIWLLGGSKTLGSLDQDVLQSIPLVFVDRKPPAEYPGDFVGTENVGSARAAVQHLIDLGHSRIVCALNMDPASTVRERLAGFRRAMSDAHVDWHDELVQVVDAAPGETEAAAADRVAQRIMSWSDPPTAVFAINDTTALQLIDSIERLGFDVPTEVSVVGFDGLLRWLPGGGRLTSAHQDFSRIGELAAELLLERIGNPESRVCQHVLLDAPLVVQSTTAPPRSDRDSDSRQTQELEVIP